MSGLMLQQSPQRCGDVAKKRLRGDNKAVAQTRAMLLDRQLTWTVSSGSKVAKDGGGIVQPRPVDVVLDDQDVMAARNRRERMSSLLV